MRFTKLLFALTCLTALCPSTMSAQHCAFCGAQVVVLNISAEDDSSAIAGLSITVLDSLGDPMWNFHWNHNDFEKDTMRFWQNPSKTVHHELIDNEHPMVATSIRFPFVKEDYVMLRHYIPGMRIVVRDPDHEANGGSFNTKTVELSSEFFYPLCSDMSSWQHGGEFVPGYAPFKVKLSRRE